MKTIVIENLYKAVPDFSFGENIIVINPKNTDLLVKMIRGLRSETDSITVYDMTRGFKAGSIFRVKDHINRTGSNPLTGRQQELGIDFPDLSNLYEDKDGIVTDCLGDRFEDGTVDYPSTWLCHVSIMVRTVGLNSIKAKLVSI